MAKIILPYTIQNGNTADGGQVQQDFDAILTQVNGNLDNANLADGAVSTTKLVDGAVTAAKLASDVKVIENIYNQKITSGSGGDIITQDITLSSARHCLMLAYAYARTSAQGMVAFSISIENKTTSTTLATSEVTSTPYPDTNTYDVFATPNVHYYGQLPSGTTTIALSASFTINEAALTIIVFGF